MIGKRDDDDGHEKWYDGTDRNRSGYVYVGMHNLYSVSKEDPLELCHGRKTIACSHLCITNGGHQHRHRDGESIVEFVE